MKISKGKKAKKFTAGALALFTLMLIAAPHQVLAGECDRALLKCAVDAWIATLLGTIAGLFSGNIVGALIGAGTAGGSYLTWCLIGYDFCKRYYAI